MTDSPWSQFTRLELLMMQEALDYSLLLGELDSQSEFRTRDLLSRINAYLQTKGDT